LFRVALLCVALVPLGSLAQDPEATLGATNPQDAVREYLEASRSGEYEKAALYLNLRGLPPKRRAARGPDLARQLKVILDQTLWVDWEALSPEATGDPEDGLPPGHDRIGTIQTATGPLDVLVERVRAPSTEPQWRFAGATVARIGNLYDEFGYGRLGDWLPEPLFTIRFLEIELWQWLGLITLLVVSWVVGSAGALILVPVVRRLARRTRSTIDDHLLEAAASPLVLFFGVATFYAGSFGLALSVQARRVVTGATKGLLILAITWLALRIVDVVAGGLERRLAARGDVAAHTVIQMGSRVTKVFLLILAVLSALSNLGFNVTGLIAGLGVGGIAIALAAQKTFENFFGGISMLVDKPIQVGEFCRYGDKIGTVEQIGLRSTRIRSLDRTLVTVPNAEFSSIQIENFAARDRIRFHTMIGLRYETTADQLRWVLIEGFASPGTERTPSISRSSPTSTPRTGPSSSPSGKICSSASWISWRRAARASRSPPRRCTSGGTTDSTPSAPGPPRLGWRSGARGTTCICPTSRKMWRARRSERRSTPRRGRRWLRKMCGPATRPTPGRMATNRRARPTVDPDG
jgi:MscS family membrane protein